MRFRVLGSLEVRRDGAVVPVGSARQRTLLAALLAKGGDVASTDELAAGLWGDRPPGDPRNAVQTYVARLRETLGPDVDLVTARPGYALRLPPEEVDARRFEELLAEAQRHDQAPAVVRDLLSEALGLWRGPAYAEFADDVARAEALRLDERRLVAVEEHAAARLALGEAADVVAELEALATQHPLRERFVELRMRALAAEDRQAEALAVHRSYRERLAEETGLEPSPSLRELEGQVLRGQLAGTRRVRAADRRGANRPPDGAPAPVPVVSTSLVGREREIDEVRAALERQPVVTLTGTGGVGKTRVAAEVARRVHDDGQWEVGWVELAPVTDPSAIEHVVAAALAVDLAGGQPPQQALLDALEGRRLLLVLDNCEHLLDAIAPLVDGIRQRHPACRVLATSRERLALDGEWVLPIAPLSTEPDAGGDSSAAIQLFVDRAAAVSARYERTSELPLVAEICRELDGLPLAIELAAARSGALGLEDLLAAWREDPAAVGHRRSGPGRHRDLSAVADWSYRLLDEPTRRLFERLSVFAGVFDADEAHAVAAPEGQPRAATFEQLTALVEGSLVAGVAAPFPGRTGRYRMLRPLARFAHERLADRQEVDAVADRHASVLVERAERAAGPPLTAAGQRWLEAYLDDLRTVHRRTRRSGDLALGGRLVAALYRFNYWRTGVELGAWADDVVAMEGIDDQPAAPQVHAAAAAGAWMRGDLERAGRLARRGATLGAGPDDPARTVVFEALGDVASFQGQLDDAVRAFSEAVRLAALGDDPDSEAVGLVSVALCLAYAGDTHEAIAQADAADRVARRAGPMAQAFARYAQGECRAETAPSEAIALVEEALELARPAEAGFIEGVARLTAATLRSRRDEPTQALPAFAELIARWRRSGNWTQQWTTLRNLVELLVRLEVDEPAVVIAAAADAETTAAPTFGAESERLARALSTARARLGDERFALAGSRGRRLSPSETVDFALAAIEGIEVPGTVGAGGRSV